MELTFEQELAKQKGSKKEISNMSFGILWAVSGVILVCLSLQNALYGWWQSSDLMSAVVLAVLFGAGDYAFSTISNIYLSGWAGFFATVAAIGLAFLSFTAGLSFMLMLGHQADIGNSRLGELRAELETNRVLFEKHAATRTSERMQVIKSQIEEEEAKSGANVASQNAIYLKVSEWTGFAYEGVSLILRALWILVMILTSFALACLKGATWCPWKERSVVWGLKSKHQAKLKALEAQLEMEERARDVHARLAAARQQRPVGEGDRLKKPVEVVSEAGLEKPKLEVVNTKPKKVKVSSGKSRRVAPTLTQLEKMVKSGKVKPGKKAFMNLGMGTSRACESLKALAEKGVITKDGNRYVAVAA